MTLLISSLRATVTHLLCLAAVATSVVACSRSAAAPSPPPPPLVSILQLTSERVPLSNEWVATLDGYVNAQIRPQVSGYLLARPYREGGNVRKGAVLFEIDPRPFEASLAQLKARIAEAQAQLGKVQRDLERDRPLAEQRAIAQSQLENDIQARLIAEAAVQSAMAAVKTAELNLGFTHVTSPVDGVAAIATAQIGDLVGPTTLLTTVSQIDPIKAYFSLTEPQYLQVANRINAPGTVKGLWSGDAGLSLVLSDGSVYPKRGTFFAADREIDPKTGTIRISATFPNPDHILRPGQYGRVRAETRVVPDALLVPQRAVIEMQGTFQIRVLDDQNRVHTKRVKMGERLGDRWMVNEGLSPGDRIVVEGAGAVDGAIVEPRPFVPAAEH